MNEIQDVKEVIDVDRFRLRAKQDPKRIHGFLLCTDEHDDFRAFVQKSWRTLDVLSGHSCDIYTLEKWEFPDMRFKSPLYIPVDGGRYGSSGIERGDRFGFPGQNVAIDNGIRIPDRTECFRVRDALFEKPADVVLPGFAVFPSVTAKKARYYKCGALKPNDLSELFQVLLTSVRTAYKEGTDSTEVFDMLVRAERIRAFKKYAFDAILKLSVMDLLKTIGNAFHLVMPKSQSRKPDD